MDKGTPAKMLVLMLALLFGSINADEFISKKEIHFTGQENESFSLKNQLTETRYRTETRDTTCYREVPYQDQECEMVPEYDTVCRTIPGREDCRTEYDRQCRTETDYRRECTRSPDRERCSNETRYRKECERGPSRRECRNERRTRQECHMDNSNRECRTEPAREQCRTNSSGQRNCRTIPAREICTNKPERVCRDVPYTEQVCNTVPGEVQCRQVAYQERVCHTIPGEESCRNVPYSNEVCEDVPRQACEWIPSRQDCQTTQIGENQVCRDVTRYRTESYACTEDIQVPYTVTLKNYLLNSELNFEVEEGYQADFILSTSLTKNGQTKFLLGDTRETSPMAFMIKTEESSESGKDVTIAGTYNLEVLNSLKIKEELGKISKVELSIENLKFAVSTHEKVQDYEYFLKLENEGNTLFSRALTSSEVLLKKEGEQLLAIVDFKTINLKLEKLQKYTYKVGVLPKFKKELAFPAIETFRSVKTGTAYTFETEDLQRLKDQLDKLSNFSLSTDELGFSFPNHDFISDAKISLKVGDQFERELTKDEFTWNITTKEVLVSVNMEKLELNLSVLEKNSVEVKVEYIFNDEAPLPDDFTYTARLLREEKANLGEAKKAMIQKDANFLENVELYKYSLKFKLKKNPLLSDFKLKLHISKKGKVKIDKHFSKSEISVEEKGEFLQVKIDFKKFDGKVSKFGKHDVRISIEHELHSAIRNTRGIDLTHQVQENLGAK